MKLHNIKDWHRKTNDNDNYAKFMTAKTGKLFNMIVYRGQIKQIVDRERGIIYSPLFAIAKEYAEHSIHGKNGHILRTRLILNNPLVTTDKKEALIILSKQSPVCYKYVKLLSRKNALDPTLYGDPRLERAIATAARQAGFDGVIYLDLAEIVAL